MTLTQSHEGTTPRTTPWTLLAILLLTAAIALFWGHFKLLDQDEVFVLQTDSVASVGALINVQRHAPISLDPMFYHLLSHLCVDVLGATTFAIRLPSLAGYLLMQICLFRVGRTLAGDRAGLIAAAIPALCATLFYAVEARPYGVLLGLSALLLLSWMRATAPAEAGRKGWLVALAVSLGLALNTHYFAVLLLLPLCGAELYRTVCLRRLDWPVIVFIAAGTAGIALALPFQHAAGEFRLHYYNAGRVGVHAVTQSYRALFLNYTDYSMRVQYISMAVLVLLALLLAVTLPRGWRARRAGVPIGAETFLALLAALPFAGFLLARYVTHSIEVRYVLAAITGLAPLIAVALRPHRWTVRGYGAAMAGLLLVTAVAGAERVRAERVKTTAKLASLVIPAEVRARLLARPGARLFVQNLGDFEEDSPYVADPVVRSRLTLLYSRDEEVRRLQHDTAALTAMHLQRFTHVPVQRYEDLKQQPGEHLLLLRYGGGWNWIGPALADDRAYVERLAHALGGDVAAVQFVGKQP